MPIAPLSSGLQLHADATSPGVGRFVIERPLSAGGFAITYLARDQQFDDRCVIKELAIDQLMVRSGTNMVPLPGREDDVAIWVQKVQKEAQVLHRLRTSGVVPIRATWRESGTAYFAMDFIDGIELPAEPTAGAGWATWETVARKFLTALGAIHAAGLVHGDIKPANILVDRAGNPVIIDFGTARSAEDAKKTKLTTLAMTPGYCPPELAVRDRAKEMGPWSDLYSWALTVMGLVIRHGGIDGAPLDTSARTALAKHGHSDAGIGSETAVALRAAGVPESWVQALMACVALEPSARPQSAEEVAARIDAAPAPHRRSTGSPVPNTAATVVPDSAATVSPSEPSLTASNSRSGIATTNKILLGVAALTVLFLLIPRQLPAPASGPDLAASAGSEVATTTNTQPDGEPDTGPGIEQPAAAASGSGAAAAPAPAPGVAASAGSEVAKTTDTLPDGQPDAKPSIERTAESASGAKADSTGSGSGSDVAALIAPDGEFNTGLGPSYWQGGIGKFGGLADSRGRLSTGVGGGPIGVVSSDRNAPTPKVYAQPFSVTGALEMDVVSRVIREHRREIVACYETALQRTPELQGRIDVDFVIGPDGFVDRTNLRASTLSTPTVGSCAIRRIMEWRFPKPTDGGTVRVSYPWIFTSGG
jgi:serine/threonine protein kinase